MCTREVWLKSPEIIMNTLECCVGCLVTKVLMISHAAFVYAGELSVDIMDENLEQFNSRDAEVLLHSSMSAVIPSITNKHFKHSCPTSAGLFKVSSVSIIHKIHIEMDSSSRSLAPKAWYTCCFLISATSWPFYFPEISHPPWWSRHKNGKNLLYVLLLRYILDLSSSVYLYFGLFSPLSVFLKAWIGCSYMWTTFYCHGSSSNKCLKSARITSRAGSEPAMRNVLKRFKYKKDTVPTSLSVFLSHTETKQVVVFSVVIYFTGTYRSMKPLIVMIWTFKY